MSESQLFSLASEAVMITIMLFSLLSCIWSVFFSTIIPHPRAGVIVTMVSDSPQESGAVLMIPLLLQG